MSGHLAFLSMLGLFPFLIFLISLAALVGQSQAGIEAIGMFFDQLPTDVQDVLYNPVNRLLDDTSGGILTTSVFVAVWVSSSTVDAARVAVQRAHGLPEAPVFWKRRLEGIGLVIVAATSIIAGMAIYVLGPAVWKAINTIIAIEGAWTSYLNWARFASSVLLMFSALYALHFALRPTGHRRNGPIIPGVIATLALWMAVGAGFSTYLKYFGQYGNTYGSLAGPIIALLFFYLVNATFLYGAELNSTILKFRERYAESSNEVDK